jgi:hypothetical protein
MLYTQPLSQAFGSQPQSGQASQPKPGVSRSPNMSAYSFTPPRGARQNDLSAGNLPYNLWQPAAANAANRAFGNSNQIQSYTMPGTMQSFNGLTGQARSKQSPSWDGNNAYMPVSQRAGPVYWNMTGWDGRQGSGQQGWQQLANQRDAFAGGLIQRLGEYQSGQQSGRPTFDFQAILNQANESLKNNTWQNPFMDPRARNVPPTMSAPTYDPSQTAADPPRLSPATPDSPPIIAADKGVDFSIKAPGMARPVTTPDPGTPYGQPMTDGWRMPGPDPVGPAYTSKPPSQWTEADWAEYQKPYETGHLRYLVHTPKYYRDNQGRVRYYSGGHTDSPDHPMYMDGDEAWRRNQQRRRDNPGPTFYA